MNQHLFNLPKTGKKVLSIMLSLTLVVTMSFGSSFRSYAVTPSDISGHWAKQTIQSWLDQGFIAGYPDGNFRPDNTISRAEFMTLVNKAFGYTVSVPISFSDVKADAWYAGAVAIAKAAGYIGGYPDGTMRPDNPISREEAAMIITKINKIPDKSFAANKFKDSAMMSWSKGAIGAASDVGIMKGYPDGNFKPHSFIKRGEAVVALSVKDEVSPVLQIIGLNPASANLVIETTEVTGLNGYADPGAVASDNWGGDLSSSIMVSGTVNTSVTGTYTLKYTVSDAANNKASITRTVNVVGRLDPLTIPKYATPMLIPWAMPKSIDPNPTANTDYYEIAMRQINQQVLPAGMPETTLWAYGSTNPGAVFHAPSLTIEATANKPIKIKWINDLIDENGNYLPHLLPIDQTLHWANPGGGSMGNNMAGTSQVSYVGPVPIVTHVHGAHVRQESDGYPEAWYLPDAKSIPEMYAKEGTFYDIYKATAQSGSKWTPGSAVFDYANDQRDATIWYHDHAMGITRTNVYAGPAGFYLIRGNAADKIKTLTGAPAILPGPAPLSSPVGPVYEIPIALQDRAFNTDGSLFYANSRFNFDEFGGPYSPTSDIAPIWNPEFFGDTIIANGNTWPFQNVEPKRYRLRFLNGSQARTFILKLHDMTAPETSLSFWQIGSDGGFLASPAQLTQLLMGPAERADVIVDFSSIPVGDVIRLENLGPDGPYKGGVPGDGETPGTFLPADPDTTGQVMEFRVIASNGTPDPSTSPNQLKFPAVAPLVPNVAARQLSINEEMSDVLTEPDTEMPIGPKAALLGTVIKDRITGQVIGGAAKLWSDDVTEEIKLNTTEAWELYNFTEDAHPIHLHLVEFQVVDRQKFDVDTGELLGEKIMPQAWETGFKDTVIAYPGQITRIRAKFDIAGRYVWHCHILEHEDNEMMRPYLVK